MKGSIPRKPAALFCTVLGTVVAVQLALSLVSVAGKSATWDEPMHVYAGWRSLVHLDLRFNPEHPPLFKYWAALPSLGLEVAPGDSLEYRSIFGDVFQSWAVVIRDLFQHPGAAGLELIWRGRCMMAVLACLMTVAAGLLAREIGGNLAGAIVALAVGLDPNTLGHGPLITNDIAATLLFIVAALLVARLCREVTWLRMGLLILLAGLGLCTKFSGALLVPLVGICLLVRAFAGGDWRWCGKLQSSVIERCMMVAGYGLASALGAWLVVWAAYGFRETATSDGQRFSAAALAHEMRWFRTLARIYPRADVTNADLAAHDPGLIESALVRLDRLRVMPNAWTYGVSYVYARSALRPAYLMGMRRDLGWWYYFPVAMLFKAPSATLLAVLAATAMVITAAPNAWRALDGSARWTIACTLVLACGYAAYMMAGSLNIGFRHFFPTYYLLVVLAWTGVAGLAQSCRLGGLFAMVLAGGLIASTAGSFPGYIAHFNLPSRLIGRPAELLADSNLDWGQDLPLLAAWQRANPDTRLYLSYFGTADPAAYGIRAIPADPRYVFGPPAQPVTLPGVWAMSVTWAIQGMHLSDKQLSITEQMRRIPPRQMLGETILLYDVPAVPATTGQTKR